MAAQLIERNNGTTPASTEGGSLSHSLSSNRKERARVRERSRVHSGHERIVRLPQRVLVPTRTFVSLLVEFIDARHGVIPRQLLLFRISTTRPPPDMEKDAALKQHAPHE